VVSQPGLNGALVKPSMLATVPDSPSGLGRVLTRQRGSAVCRAKETPVRYRDAPFASLHHKHYSITLASIRLLWKLEIQFTIYIVYILNKLQMKHYFSICLFFYFSYLPKTMNIS
jgi:hypothetical protein